jgi:hypothetical protein
MFGLITLLYVNYFNLHNETLKFGGLQVSAMMTQSVFSKIYM